MSNLQAELACLTAELVFTRNRTEKTYPNTHMVLHSTCLSLFFPLTEAFLSVCCTFSWSGGSEHYIQQHSEWSFPAGWLQLWCESHVQHTGPGCHLSASENEPEFPSHSHSVPLYFQPQRHFKHLPGVCLWNRLKCVHLCSYWVLWAYILWPSYATAYMYIACRLVLTCSFLCSYLFFMCVFREFYLLCQSKCGTL